MSKSTKYVVFSNGFVLTGFEVDDVAKSLANRYDTNEKKIKKCRYLSMMMARRLVIQIAPLTLIL